MSSGICREVTDVGEACGIFAWTLIPAYGVVAVI